MRIRIRYALPLAQMALAVWCLRLAFLFDVAQRQARSDSPQLPPAFQLLLFLNLPIGVPLKLTLWGYLPTLWFDVVFVAAIGVFWYWLTLQVGSYRRRRTILPFAWTPARVAVDLGLIAAGADLGWGLIENARVYPSVLSPANLRWQWFIPVWTSLLLWSLGTIFVFGNDLIQNLRAGRAQL